MVTDCMETQNIGETARRWQTSREVVRKRVTRYEAERPEGKSPV